MKRRWSDVTMNQLILEIKDHYIANEAVKFIKEYFINFEKIMKRLQLTIFKYRKKMNWSIRTTAVYILNDFKRAHSKIYFNFSASTRKNLRAIDLMIKNMKLIKNFRANAFFSDDFVENFSIIVSKVDIIEIDTSTSLTKAVVFKFSILKVVFVISRTALQVEKIDYLNKSNVVSFAINSVLS